FFLLFPRPPLSIFFPYTTLFRSDFGFGRSAIGSDAVDGLESEARMNHSFGVRLAGWDVGKEHHPGRLAVYSWNVGEIALAGGAKDRKSTRLNSSYVAISYAVFCL